MDANGSVLKQDDLLAASMAFVLDMLLVSFVFAFMCLLLWSYVSVV